MPTEAEKIDAIIAKLATGENIQSCEFVKVSWNGGANTEYYATSAYSRVNPFRGVKNYTSGQPVRPRIKGDPFQKFEINGDVRTEYLPLTLDDTDGAIKLQFETYGPPRLDLYRYYPEQDYCRNLWWGVMLTPQIWGKFQQSVQVTNGKRSRERFLPNEMIGSPDDCFFRFGNTFESLAQWETGGCPVNNGLPGGTFGELDPITGLPYAQCPKDIAGGQARTADAAKWCGQVGLAAATVPTDSHPGNFSYSHGNETSRNKPLTVFAGNKYYRGGILLQYAKELNTSHPEQGFIRTKWLLGQKVQAVSSIKVAGKVIGFEHINIRLGERGQAVDAYPGTTENFTTFSTVFARIGPLNPDSVDPKSLTMECLIAGYPDVAIFTAEATYTRHYSDDRVWWLLEAYSNQKWGLTHDHSQFWIEDYWMPASVKTRKATTLTLSPVDAGDPDRIYTSVRTKFDAALSGEPATDQIVNICRSGKLSVPYQVNGKYAISVFSKISDGDLAAAPVFIDRGPGRNIQFKGPEAVTFDHITPDALANEITLTFEAGDNNDLARPIRASDKDQQALANQLLGTDTGFFVVPKPYFALGVRDLNEAVKLLYFLLWFGDLNNAIPGVRNNCIAKFVAPLEWTYKVPRYAPLTFDLSTVEVPKNPLTGTPFQYFQLMNVKKIDKNDAMVTAIAYNKEAWDAYEVEEADPPPAITCTLDTDCPPGYVCFGGVCVVDPSWLPGCRPGVGTPTYDAALRQLTVPIDPC
jgi:hypothetical protein